MPKVITAAGREYLVRYPVGAMIRAEIHLGKPVSKVNWRAASFHEMSILTRYGLHTIDGKPISGEEYDLFLEEVGVPEFTELFKEIVSELTPEEESTGKN